MTPSVVAYLECYPEDRNKMQRALVLLALHFSLPCLPFLAVPYHLILEPDPCHTKFAKPLKCHYTRHLCCCNSLIQLETVLVIQVLLIFQAYCSVFMRNWHIRREQVKNFTEGGGKASLTP
uniref:Uncharacterized protein n=1 Tax=Micrurus spixii TaxID=129469 RepID=A0A2D4N0Z4_9SAUR